MEWTDIRLTVAKADAENAEAVATLIAEGGIYIEDYSDIEQQVAEIAHVDLIEQELLDKPRDTVIIHMYLEPGASPVETLALIQARMEAAGIAYTVETEGVEQEDWQNGWRKYYHPMDIGKRLAIVPSWQEYDTDRVKLILDPGLAFGTGGHETTSLCLEALDEQVRGGERVLDIGTGSGILAIAALKLALPKPRAWILTPCACAPPARMPSETAWPSTLPCWWAIFLTKPAANTTSSPQTLWRRLSCPLRRMCRY